MKNSVGKIEKLSASSGSQFCTRKFELVWIWSCNISLERLWEEDDENKDIDLKLAHWLFLSPKKTYLVKMESVRCCCILCLLNMFICHRTQLKSACTICMSIFLEVLPYVLDYCIQYTYIVLGVLGLEARKKEEGEEGIKWWACDVVGRGRDKMLLWVWRTCTHLARCKRSNSGWEWWMFGTGTQAPAPAHRLNRTPYTSKKSLFPWRGKISLRAVSAWRVKRFLDNYFWYLQLISPAITRVNILAEILTFLSL